MPPTYRDQEVSQVAGWIKNGQSGCVVGLAESGRSNLLTFLTRRSDVLESHLSDGSRVVLVPVEIFNLPSNDLSSLYRTILHAFYWERERIDPKLHKYATELYMENRKTQDPFLPQMALYDLLRAFEDANQRVVLIFNRFDRFCETATPQMLNTVRGLRDAFKGTLSYIMGMLQEVIYLADGVPLGDVYDILDRHVCWVGSMTIEDARLMLFRDVVAEGQSLADGDIATILRLSGCFPGLLKTAGTWWCEKAFPNGANSIHSGSGGRNFAEQQETLLREPSMLFRLERIWNSLTQEEQLVLSEVQKIEPSLPPEYDPIITINDELAEGSPEATHPHEHNAPPAQLSKATQKLVSELARQHEYTLNGLVTKGLCQRNKGTWWIKSSLLSAFVETQEGRARGRIWIDEQTKQIQQGQQIIQDLPGLQHTILAFLIRNPRVRHTNDEIINNAWPDEDQREGISDNALQVHVRSIRKRLEPNPAKPNYLVTWRGSPGGYIFYPEGKPD